MLGIALFFFPEGSVCIFKTSMARESKQYQAVVLQMQKLYPRAFAGKDEQVFIYNV